MINKLHIKIKTRASSPPWTGMSRCENWNLQQSRDGIAQTLKQRQASGNVSAPSMIVQLLFLDQKDPDSF